MNSYILAIDQSTSGTKALIFNAEGEIVGRADRPHKQITNQQGWVEHDSMEIWQNVLVVCKDVLEQTNIPRETISAIGISNQRETTVLWDKVTGFPIHNAFVWQCPRAESICQRIEDSGASPQIKKITGLHLSPYFSAGKIAWGLKNLSYNISTLCAGTMDSWLLFKMTNGASFFTDYSNASRTQLFDITTLFWSREVADLFGIPPEILPTPLPSNSLFGTTDLEGLLPTAVPIHSMLGDSHGALFGQGCHQEGMIKITYGTGSSVMMNIGDKPIDAQSGIVTSIAWGMNDQVYYVLEGNINYTGAIMTWIVDDLGLLSSPKEAGSIAALANPEDTTYLVPAFSGLSAPYWDSNAKALLCGMTRTTKKAEIVKAAEESIALQIADIIAVMKENGSFSIESLRVDGGPTKDSFLMQCQSDVLGIPVEVANVEELSALGAAMMAGITIGLYDPSIIDQLKRTPYLPKITDSVRKQKLVGWQSALKKALLK